MLQERRNIELSGSSPILASFSGFLRADKLIGLCIKLLGWGTRSQSDLIQRSYTEKGVSLTFKARVHQFSKYRKSQTGWSALEEPLAFYLFIFWYGVLFCYPGWSYIVGSNDPPALTGSHNPRLLKRGSFQWSIVVGVVQLYRMAKQVYLAKYSDGP